MCAFSRYHFVTIYRPGCGIRGPGRRHKVLNAWVMEVVQIMLAGGKYHRNGDQYLNTIAVQPTESSLLPV